MNNLLKNLIGCASVVAILILSYVAVGFVNTYDKSIQPSSFRSFTVAGEGKVMGRPDVATFTYGIITEGGMNLEEIQKQHVANSNKINSFVKSLGVKDEDIKTENYSVEPKYQYFNCGVRMLDGAKPCPPPEITGYTLRETVLVKVRNFDKVGDILSGTVNSGANQVSQLSFMIDDQTKVENDARTEAISKAKIKAIQIANASGFRLGRLLNISEGGGPVMFYGKTMMTEGGFGGGGGASAPAIEPGSQDVRVTVTLTYEIQ